MKAESVSRAVQDSSRDLSKIAANADSCVTAKDAVIEVMDSLSAISDETGFFKEN